MVVGSQAYQRNRLVGRTVGVAQSLSGWFVIAGVLALSLSSLWFVSRAYQLQQLLGLAAADTGRFEGAEDGEHVGVYRRALAGLDSSSGVIIVVMRATRQKKGSLICRLY